MVTIVYPQGIVTAVNESVLSPTAVDIVQPDPTSAIGNLGAKQRSSLCMK